MIVLSRGDIIAAYGSEDAFADRVADFVAELNWHSKTVNVPAPTTDDPAIDAAARQGYVIVEDAPSEPVDPVAARRLAILDRLAIIDQASVRSLRAALAGTATDEDRAKIAALDAEAQVLRAELAALAT
jgi:hypothetical protein